MQRMLVLAVLLLSIAPVAAQDQDPPIGPKDWPWWRGPQRNGHADPNQKLPLKWSETENLLWKVPVPGRGHGSPIVVGDQIFLATADAKTETQSMLCYNRHDGKLLWQTEVHRGGAVSGGANKQSSLASSTAACDGERVYINFLHDKSIYTTALTRDGKIVWQTKVANYVLHQGFASSPAVYQSLVIVSADNKGTGKIAALERSSGKIVWQIDRPKWPNYASPIILKVAGKEQLFFIGCELVTSLNPLTGEKFWETKGSTQECVTSTVTDGKSIISSGGYPKAHVAAISGDGSAKTIWESKIKVYVPSLIERQGYLYGVQDGGIAVCWKFDTGEEKWKGRLTGAFSASPVLVGDKLYATSERGTTFVYKASPDAFELLAENQLGNEAMATPTICGNRFYQRGALNEKGQRQEMLYCVGLRE